jgi:hypothetical protein
MKTFTAKINGEGLYMITQENWEEAQKVLMQSHGDDCTIELISTTDVDLDQYLYQLRVQEYQLAVLKYLENAEIELRKALQIGANCELPYAFDVCSLMISLESVVKKIKLPVPVIV